MRSFSFLVATVFATFTLAQSPQSFNYQGVARDAMGEPLSGQAIGVEFQLRSGSALGPVVYSETHGATTDMFGLFTLHVGEGTAGTGTFSAIDWSHGPYFLEVGLDLSASGIHTSFGTQQLLSVPYALHAGSSGDLPDGTEVGQIMHWDGGAWVADSGLYVHTKRFGVGIEQPEAPLGIKGEPGQDDRMISFHSSDVSQKWNIDLNPTGDDVDGFSIDDASSGVGSSRLFIEQASGNVGVGNTDPGAPLSIKNRNDLYEEFKNGDIPSQDDFVITTGGNSGLSFDQDTSGGYASRLAINSSTGHVGIGTNDPPAALSIESRDILKTYFQTGDIPTEQDFAIRTDSTGFDIGQGTPNALASRLFIDHVSQGNIGIGNVDPKAKLHVSGANDGGNVSIMVENLESSANGGWLMSAVDDNAVPERTKTFVIHEKTGVELTERITVLAGGNVGINEVLPYAKLHVSRPTSDPSSSVALAENTGILCLGQIEDNLAADYRGIQARHGEYIGGGPTLSFTVSDLNLQRLGGDILIHGDDAVASHHVSISGDGKVGIGKVATEKLEIDGAIVVGTTDNVAPSNGTIRWNTATEDLEGFVGTTWTSLTSGGWQKVDNTDNIYYDAGTTPRVGIGTSTPDVTLHVSRPLADPFAAMGLTEGSGIMVLGPMTDNIVMDHQGIQARQVLAGATSLVGSGLHLQRLGGDILIHGDDALESNRVIVTGGGRIGVGTLTPEESIHTTGAIKIGNSIDEEDGTIRWTGTDFEGRKGGSWNSLTTHTNTDGLWQVGPTGGIEYSPPGGGAKVSLLPLPSTPVRVDSWAAVVERSVGAQFQNTSTTSSANPADNRVGVQILNDGTWGGSPASKDIGLYVSQVGGQSEASSNIAALINGNVVIGDVTNGQVVGTNGSRVLSIQNGTVPATGLSGGPGSVGGVQVYSADVSGVPALHVMTGDGAVMKLYRQPDMTAADNSTMGPGMDPTTAALIDNMRTRINELEQTLKALGLLTP